jgi:hypothetical protein
VIKKSIIPMITVFAAAVFISCGGRDKAAAVPEKVPACASEEKTASSAMKKAAAHKPIKTEDDIKEVYGRLEVVTLTDGKRYRGAVISVGEEYTMVTAGGIVRIPMNEVGARDIIR